MEIKQEYVDELKKIFKEDYGKEYTDSEAREAAQNLVGLADLLVTVATEQKRKQAKLKEHPEGFPLDNTHSCVVCQTSVNAENGWYDKAGPVCLDCHRAFKTKVISRREVKESKNYYTSWELSNYFNVHPMTQKKAIREGKLKAREIKNDSGGVHFTIYMTKENPDYLPNPKPAYYKTKVHNDGKTVSSVSLPVSLKKPI